MDSSSAVTCDASFSPLFFAACVFAFPTVFWLTSYLIPQIYMVVRPVPNLKERYQASWALVTGGGSGIGKALSFKLASQGLNIVVVSLDDDMLKRTMKELNDTYPKLQFRSVGVDFAPGVDYMSKIKEATKDIEVPIIFNNAGFMVTGFIDQAPIGRLLTNIECNATAAVNVAHYFGQKMVKEKKKGCIVFTSSVAGFIPTPFAAMYASTKAFVSQFAACMHIETKSLGIDVCAIHPSPVASSFYDKLDHKVDMIEAAAKGAVKPDSVTDDMLRSIGACALRDMGGTCNGENRLLLQRTTPMTCTHSFPTPLCRLGLGNSHWHLLSSIQCFRRIVCLCCAFSTRLEEPQQESLRLTNVHCRPSYYISWLIRTVVLHYMRHAN
jgi:short-subunit dehydrogenase